MSNPEYSPVPRSKGKNTTRIVFIVALVIVLILVAVSFAEGGRLLTSSFALGICAANFGIQLPGAARQIFAPTRAHFVVERIGLVCAGLAIVTSMINAFVPLTDDLTTYRHSMLTTCVLGAVALVSWIYLRRKAV